MLVEADTHEISEGAIFGGLDMRMTDLGRLPTTETLGVAVEVVVRKFRIHHRSQLRSEVGCVIGGASQTSIFSTTSMNRRTLNPSG